MHEEVPFGDLSEFMATREARRGERPTVDLLRDRIRFAPIITSCWSHDPNNRPSLTEVAQMLIQFEGPLVEARLAAARCVPSDDYTTKVDDYTTKVGTSM